MALTLDTNTGLYKTDATPPGSGSAKLWDTNLLELSRRSGYALLNPRAYGVTADGTTDDTAAWLAAIAAYKASDQFCGIMVPRGESCISDTLLFESVVGLRLVGAGARLNIGAGYDSISRASVIKCHATNDFSTKPMLDFYKAHNTLLSGFTLIGQTTDTVSGAATAGIRYRSQEGVFGSSQFDVDGLAIHRCVNGFQSGNDARDYASNDSEVRIRGTKFGVCTNGILVGHNQSVNWMIDHPDFNTVTNCLYLAKANIAGGAAGGAIHMRGAMTYYCDRLVYAEHGGTNAGINIIDGFRFDNPSSGGKRTKILEMASTTDGGSYWDIRGGMDKHPNPGGGTARIILHKSAFVSVRNCNQLCGAGGPLLSLEATSGTCYAEVTGCELPEILAQIVVTPNATPSSNRYWIHHNHSAGVPHGSGSEWKQ